MLKYRYGGIDFRKGLIELSPSSGMISDCISSITRLEQTWQYTQYDKLPKLAGLRKLKQL